MAIGSKCVVAMPSCANTSVSTGTIVNPPPMPSSPARKPTNAPSSRKTGISAALKRRSLAAAMRVMCFHSARRHRRDRQPAAALQQHHVLQRRVVTQFGQRDERRLLAQPDIDIHPARRGSRRLGVEIRALAIELRRIRVRGARNLDNAGDARHRTARMVEKREIAHLHVVAHVVARLVVAHAEPRRRLLRRAREIVDRHLVGLGFHQPISHRSCACSHAPLGQSRIVPQREADGIRAGQPSPAKNTSSVGNSARPRKQSHR